MEQTRPPGANAARRCVYTVLTGAYETLNEQPMAAVSALPFICFCDDPDLTSTSWQVRPLTPLLPGDPIRSQRAGKLRPHALLPDFDASFYIDNSVILTRPPEEVFAATDLAPGLAIPAHSFRASVEDEFLAVAADGLDEGTRLFEQMNQYALDDPEALSLPPLWSAIMLRDHRHPVMVAAMDVWLAHVLRHSRRDQLSSRIAFRYAGLQPTVLAIDNHRSWFHTWPHPTGRRQGARLWRGASLAPLATQARAARVEAAALESRLAQQAAEAQAQAEAQAAAAAEQAQRLAEAEQRRQDEQARLLARQDRMRAVLIGRLRQTEQERDLARAEQARAAAALAAAKSRLEEEKAGLAAAVERARAENQALRAENDALQAGSDALRTELRQAAGAHGRAEAARAALATEIEALAAAHRAVLGSTCWRATAPARRLGRMLRGA